MSGTERAVVASTVTERSLSLPQDDTAAQQTERVRELAAQCEAYSPWTPIPSDDGLPRPMQLEVKFTVRRPVLPKAERFWRTALAATSIGMVMGREMTMGSIRSLGRRFSKARTGTTASDGPSRLVERYLPMFAADEHALLPLGGRTLDDAGFALQRLYGTAPYMLERVRTLPGHVDVRDGDLAAVLPPGVTLDGLVRSDSLFVVDTTAAYDGQLGHRALVDAGICAAPASLFFADPHTGSLRPCAIQLVPGGRDGHTGPVFTPDAPPGAWLAAKLFANRAESIAHTAGLHVAGNHAFAQVVVAMRRTLSVRHPIRAFAEPWMNEVLPALALMQLANYPMPAWKATSGPLGGQYWRTFRLDDYHFRRRVESRGVAPLTVFPWRDNMLDLWDAFERFARNFVCHVYRDDGALVADTEIQAWGATLNAPDLCNLRASSLEATGGRFTSRDQLVEVLTTLHFFMTVWHGYDAFNWSWFAWIPSTPLDFVLNLPTCLDDIPIDAILAALPNPGSKTAREQRAAILAVRQEWQHSRLTTGGPDGHSVPRVNAYLAGIPGADRHVRAWFTELEELGQRFATRDRALVAAGHLPAPAATYPANCAGSMWYG